MGRTREDGMTLWGARAWRGVVLAATLVGLIGAEGDDPPEDEGSSEGAADPPRQSGGGGGCCGSRGAAGALFPTALMGALALVIVGRRRSR